MITPAYVTPAYVAAMAAYNAGMNHRVYAAADRLGEAARRREAGLHWGSLHGTLSHLAWADTQWMSRLAGWSKPGVGLADSHRFIEGFDDLRQERVRLDAAMTEWAAGLTAADLAGPLTWFSGAAGREVTLDRGGIVMHLFNHQTHHRGQAHAAITAAGERTGDTDLFLVVPDRLGGA